MKKEDFVKLGFSEEDATKAAKASAEELKTYIPKVRFDEVNVDKKALETTLAERDGQLETLKNANGDVEAMKKQIADLQTDNKAKDDAHASEMKQLKVESAVSAALTGAKAKNSKAVKALLELDHEKIEFADDGSVKGLSEQITKLLESEDTKFLFDTDKKKTTMKGATPGEQGKEEPDTKIDISKMNYEEIAAYLDENPEATI